MKIDRHHKFSKKKKSIEKYGRELINDNRNIQIMENGRHITGKGKKLTEREFCEKMGILKCEYCKKIINIKDDPPCLYYYGPDAEGCRFFEYDKTKKG